VGRFGGGPPEEPWVALGLSLAAGAAGLGGLVWAIGQLAALTLGSGALATGAAEMPGVLARLPGRGAAEAVRGERASRD